MVRGESRYMHEKHQRRAARARERILRVLCGSGGVSSGGRIVQRWKMIAPLAPACMVNVREQERARSCKNTPELA